MVKTVAAAVAAAGGGIDSSAEYNIDESLRLSPYRNDISACSLSATSYHHCRLLSR